MMDKWLGPTAVDEGAAQPGPGEPLIDDATFAELTDVLGAEEFGSLILAMKNSFPKRLAELDAAMAKSDPKAVAAVAHSLKGAALNLGMKHLGAAACDLEAAGRAGEWPLESRAAPMRAAVTQTLAALVARGM